MYKKILRQCPINFAAIFFVLLGCFSPNTWSALPNFELLYTFGKQQAPDSPLVHDAVGNHYGITSQGGKFGLGIISKIDSMGIRRVLYEFDGAHGVVTPNLLLGRDGKLYGWTRNSSPVDAASNAVIYQLDPSSEMPAFNVLYNNTETIDIDELMQGRDGKLYGTKLLTFWNRISLIFQLDITQPIPVYNEIYKITSDLKDSKGFINLIQGNNNLIYGVLSGAKGSPPHAQLLE